jgi:hypothetical protein
MMVLSLSVLIASSANAGNQPPATSVAAEVTSETPSTQTFTLHHLDLEETMGVFRDMTGVEELTANYDAGTIAARASGSALRQMDTLVKVFDNARPPDSKPWKIRVFHLDHIAATQAMALLRSKLQVREAAYAPDRPCVAMRDTAERLDQAAKLLAEADVVK